MTTTLKQSAVSVFLSYAHEDEPLLRRLETHLSPLKRQGLVSTWYDRQITPGTNWAATIDARLEQASIILLLISPDFFASDYCYQIEMARALERHEAGQVRVIPILLHPVDWSGAPFAHLQALPTDARAITAWSNEDEAFANVAAGIRRALEDLSLLSTSVTRAALPPIWNIPYPRNTFFTGREDLLLQLHAQLASGQAAALSQSPQAISGLGGIGKTQLATEYAYRYQQDYEAVFWARADTLDALISSYNTIATLLKLPERDAEQQEITLAAVKTWLQTHRKWLLILDNADDLTLLPPFLPPTAGGHILLTTRAWDMRGLAIRLEVKTLPDEQGALLLLQRANLLPSDRTIAHASAKDRQLAIQLTQELGGLPLAIDQAGAYMEATGTGLEEYLRIYQTHRPTVLQDRRSLVTDHPDSVTTTWSLSFERIEQKNPAAAALLQFCAYLAPDAIPETIIIEGASHLGPLLESIATDPLLFPQAIEALRSYSLVARDSQTRTLSLHRLVQAAIRDRLSPDVEQDWKRRTILAVEAACPDLDDVKQWNACEQWLPHALVSAAWIEQEQISSTEAARLLNQTGYYLKARARYSEAEPLYERALVIREEQLGGEHPGTARSLGNLAGLYVSQERYAEAEPLYERALAVHERQLGEEHPDTVTSLNNLGMLYERQGRYGEAEPLLKRALAIREEQLGGEHPDTARSLNNLAGLYRSQGRYGEAEPLYERALAIREEQLGGEHPDTAQSLGNLGMLYRSQGRYTEAEPLLKRALAVHERQLGGEHPDTATSLNNLAGLYKSQGRYAEAEPLYKRALAIYEQRLGLEHPRTQTVRENYAILLSEMGRGGEARRRRGWRRIFDLFS